MSEFHSLANLIKRLEVATTRLEDLAMSSSSANVIAANSPPAKPSTANVEAGIPAAVEKHDAAINASLEKFIALSQELGGPVAEQVRQQTCYLLQLLNPLFRLNLSSKLLMLNEISFTFQLYPKNQIWAQLLL